jgi:hypothetical protein
MKRLISLIAAAAAFSIGFPSAVVAQEKKAPAKKEAKAKGPAKKISLPKKAAKKPAEPKKKAPAKK